MAVLFKRAVDDGSFAAAARHFGISPEMAGAHVRSLERRLGVRLVNRTTRRLHLTEVGTNYYARCASVLADIDEAEAEASSLQAAPRGLLRIAAPVTFGVRHIAPALSDYVMRYPDVTIEVAVSDRFVNLVEEGIVSIGVEKGPPIGMEKGPLLIIGSGSSPESIGGTRA